jgi:hypothetical protein
MHHLESTKTKVIRFLWPEGVKVVKVCKCEKLLIGRITVDDDGFNRQSTATGVEVKGQGCQFIWDKRRMNYH